MKFILLLCLLALLRPVRADWPQFQNTADNAGRNAAVFINRATMDTVLKFDMGSPVLAAPVIYGDTLYAACENGTVYAINRKTGDVLWDHVAAAGIVSTPAVDQDRLYIAARNGHVYGLDRFTGIPGWDFAADDTLATEKEIQAPVKMTATRLYVGCFNGRLYCLDKSGNKVWDYQTRFYIKEAPAIQNDTVVISSRDEGIYGLRDLGASCQFLWKNRVVEYGEYVPGSVGRCSPVIVNGYVFTNSAEAECLHFTRALSLSTGVTAQGFSDTYNFNTKGFAAAANGDVFSNISRYTTNPLGKGFTSSGFYLRFMRSNAAPVVIGNYYLFHTSYYPRGVYFMDPATSSFRDSLELSGYTISSCFAASDSAFFFGTYEGFLLGIGNGGLVVGSADAEQTLLDPVALAPNPFNPATAVRFSLARPSPVSVRIFDSRGVLVWEFDAFMQKGRHAVQWRAGDRAGRPLGSGVYFVRTRIGNRVSTHRALLIR